MVSGFLVCAFLYKLNWVSDYFQRFDPFQFCFSLKLKTHILTTSQKRKMALLEKRKQKKPWRIWILPFKAGENTPFPSPGGKVNLSSLEQTRPQQCCLKNQADTGVTSLTALLVAGFFFSSLPAVYPEGPPVCLIADNIPADPIRLCQAPNHSSTFQYFVVITSFKIFFNEKILGVGRPRRGHLLLHTASTQSHRSLQEGFVSLILLVWKHFSILCNQNLFLKLLKPFIKATSRQCAPLKTHLCECIVLIVCVYIYTHTYLLWIIYIIYTVYILYLYIYTHTHMYVFWSHVPVNFQCLWISALWAVNVTAIWHDGRKDGLGSRQTWVWALALLLNRCVCDTNSLSFQDPFPHLWGGSTKDLPHVVVFRIVSMKCVVCLALCLDHRGNYEQ